MIARYAPAQSARPPRPDQPVRLGFVSGYFRGHAATRIQLKGWISHWIAGSFRVFGYHTGFERDDFTKLAVANCERFVNGPMSIDNWRQAILADAPHVLIYPETGLDAISVALAAQRLAPVQCGGWGHPQPSGYPTVDYFLTSDLMEPRDGQDHYTSDWCDCPTWAGYYEPYEPPAVWLSRAELGLRPAASVYWCGQSPFKYLPQFDEVFPRITHDAGDCQFVFFEHRATDITQQFRTRLERAFATVGRRAADYCVILPRMGFAKYAAVFDQCDVFLDSIGFTGGNTTLDSLSHRIPIVTMAGPLMRGRQTAGILTMMGVTETITETIDDHVAAAVRLAHDVPWRMAIKARMAENRHRVYRDRSCIVALEEFLYRVARGTEPRRS